MSQLNDMGQQSIGTEKAIELGQSNWWEGMSHREIAGFQLFTQELCMPFSVFHEALEGALGRPVWTHEMGLNFRGLCKEFWGEAESPTMQEIIEMIPEEKRLLVGFVEAS